MAKVSNCALYLNRTAGNAHLASVPNEDIPYWSLYSVFKVDGKRHRSCIGVFTYDEMFDFIASVKTNQTFEAYPRLSKHVRGNNKLYSSQLLEDLPHTISVKS